MQARFTGRVACQAGSEKATPPLGGVAHQRCSYCRRFPGGDPHPRSELLARSKQLGLPFMGPWLGLASGTPHAGKALLVGMIAELPYTVTPEHGYEMGRFLHTLNSPITNNLELCEQTSGSLLGCEEAYHGIGGYSQTSDSQYCDRSHNQGPPE